MRTTALLAALPALLFLHPGLSAQEKKAPPQIYDPAADAHADLAAALAKAKAENQRVLIQWGANWCGWCQKLHQTLSTDAKLKHELLYEYQWVHVDVGQFDKNLDLAQQYGADIKSGIPYLTVLDGDGRVLANQETGAFEVDGAHDPAKVGEFLKAQEATPRKAADVLQGALATAAKEDKRVFLRFGAPWCPWCHKLDASLAVPEVAAALQQDFVLVKVDVDRMPGGKEMLDGYKAGSAGIPWFVFLDAQGHEVVNSNGANGNLGCPWTEDEIAQFGGMLRKAAVHLTPEQIGALLKALPSEAKEKAAKAAAKA